jgi:hypothetical protein
MTETVGLHPLLRVSEATELLGIARSQLQNMFPHLHILEMPRGSRRFSAPYIQAVGEHIPRSRYERRVYAAHEFSQSALARRLIDEAEVALDETIAEHAVPLPDDGSVQKYLSAHDIADILHLGRMSVTDWHDSGALPFLYHQRVAYVAEAALRDVLQWQQPRFAEPNVS